jgi:ABC-type nitrate/sulfonate/bicarbonate transport system permease component
MLRVSGGQQFSQACGFPYCLPCLFSALKISFSLAIVGSIAGKFIGATQGLAI